MSYSFTEKKRIRKSFAKRPSVLEVPSLLETQLHSYHEFLQADVPAAERRDEGLQGAFKSIFPIVSHNGLARLEFQEYILDDPVFDVSECQLRGLNYCSRLRAKVRLVIFDRDQPKQSTVKEIRESEVYMGEIPLMTKKGSFIINGTERVIVSQLHRSPGVFFEHDRGKTHSSGKLLFSARIIPYRGSWLDFEFDAKDILHFRIDRRRKMPGTIMLKALGMTPESILKQFYEFDHYKLTQDGATLEIIPSRLRGEIAAFDIKDPEGKVIVAKDKRINARHVREIEKLGITELPVPLDNLIGREAGNDGEVSGKRLHARVRRQRHACGGGGHAGSGNAEAVVRAPPCGAAGLHSVAGGVRVCDRDVRLRPAGLHHGGGLAAGVRAAPEGASGQYSGAGFHPPLPDGPAPGFPAGVPALLLRLRRDCLPGRMEQPGKAPVGSGPVHSFPDLQCAGKRPGAPGKSVPRRAAHLRGGVADVHSPDGMALRHLEPVRSPDQFVLERARFSAHGRLPVRAGVRMVPVDVMRLQYGGFLAGLRHAGGGGGSGFPAVQLSFFRAACRGK